MNKTLINTLLIILLILNVISILIAVTFIDDNIMLIAICILSTIFSFTLLFAFSKLDITLLQKENTADRYIGDNLVTSETNNDKTRIKEEENIVDKIFESLDPEENIEITFEKLLSNISKKFEIVQGLAFIESDKNNMTFRAIASYAHYKQVKIPDFKIGEGITGQVAKNKKLIRLDNVPENYITVVSGLGSGSPKHLLIFPVLDKDKKTKAVIELASFKDFGEYSEQIFVDIASRISDFIK